MSSYAEFLERRMQSERPESQEAEGLNPHLFPFQRELVEWAVNIGRGAIFADCGLGKTLMQLAWADIVRKRTDNGRALILTPLAVSRQTVAEGQRFGIDCSRYGEGDSPIVVTNYERLHHLEGEEFGAIVCDESSILKNYQGQRRKQITAYARKIPYRLLCTATAAPNDYTELGTSAEALGIMGDIDMRQMFFVNEDQTVKGFRSAFFGGKHGTDKWRFKGHAEVPFWQWVCSWARALRSPSDIGYSDEGFAIPELVENAHVVKARKKRPDLLFDLPSVGFHEEREERRRTISERCEMAAEIVSSHDEPAVLWCHLNDEGDELARIIPESIQVSGADSDEAKEDKLTAFTLGQVKRLITKPRIGGFGLNWQHCARQTFFASHSYEQYYQCVRRSWRFGQTRPVVVDTILSESQTRILGNLRAKQAAADVMFRSLIEHMNAYREVRIDRGDFSTKVEVPAWV